MVAVVPRRDSGASGMAAQFLRWLGQPDAITCGPACVAMAADALLRARAATGAGLDVFQIREMMGVTPRVGTTEREMARGLGAWGIGHRRLAPDPGAAHRLEELGDWLGGGGFALLRTMRHGVRHWVLAAGNAPGGGCAILDPVAGPERVDRRELAAMLAPRGWEIWLVPADSPCRDLRLEAVGDDPALRERVGAFMARAFSPFSHPDFDVHAYVDALSDWDISHGLWDRESLLGGYALAPGSVVDVLGPGGPPGFERYRDLAGVQGVGLAVDPGLRGLGFGRLLRTVPGALGFDYAFGLHLKSLGNIEHWRRVRPDVADLGDCWLSAGAVAPLRPAGIAAASTAFEAEYPRDREPLAPRGP